MKTEIEVDDEKIANAIIGAFEGGSNYWIRSIRRVAPEGMRPLDFYEAPFTEGHKVVVTLQDTITKDGPLEYDLDRKALERGLAVMREKSPKQFGRLVAEEDDASTHDVFIQCALFGEVVFA